MRHDPNTTLMDIYPKEMKSLCQETTQKPTFITKLVTRALCSHQSVHQHMTRHTCDENAVECYFVTKKTEILYFFPTKIDITRGNQAKQHN